MRRRRHVLVLTGCALAMLTGCDSASSVNDAGLDTDNATSPAESALTPSQVTPNDTTIDAALQRDLAARLVRPSEYLGMTMIGARRFLTPAELAESDPAPGADRRYAAEAVEGAASEHLTSPAATDAICTVLKFGDPAGARRNLRVGATAIPSADQVKTFDVPGIPHAVGTDVYVGGGLVGRNVLFVDGPYEYIIGFQPDPTAKNSITRKQIAGAALKWFARVSTMR